MVELATTNITDPAFKDFMYIIGQANQTDLCIVQVKARAKDSTNDIHFGMLLPTTARWNNRLLTYGNGGLIGGIQWTDMVAGAWDGFAVMGTDTGHPLTEPATFGKDKDKALDWGYRSIAVSLPLAQQIVKGYYEQSGNRVRSYYTGCSTGGRQGLRQVMEDPASFDGLLVGAPTWDWNRVMARGVQNADFNLRENETERLTTQQQFELILAQVQMKCKPTVGVVLDTDACNATMQIDTNWDEISCERLNGGNPAANCLTRIQRQIARNMTLPGYQDGRFVYEGFPITSARAWSVYLDPSRTVPPGGVFEYSANFLGNVSDNANWTWAKNAREIMDASLSDDQHMLNGARVDDLAKVSSSAAKIILYHGLADGVIPPGGSERLYGALTNKANLRFFEIPGMEHCGNAGSEAIPPDGNPAHGLRAPWYIGGVDLFEATLQGTAADQARYVMPLSARLNDTRHDALLAMVQWAEGGEAPERLVATSFNNQYSTGPDWWTPNRTQLLCPFPTKPADCV
jgi:feruloyl esterase